jgi:hypothetical protein
MFLTLALLTAGDPLASGICTKFVGLLKAAHAAKTEPPAGAAMIALQNSLPEVE